MSLSHLELPTHALSDPPLPSKFYPVCPTGILALKTTLTEFARISTVAHSTSPRKTRMVRMAARELTQLCQPANHTQHNRLRVLAPCPCASTPRPGLAWIQSVHPTAGRPQHTRCQEYGGQSSKGQVCHVPHEGFHLFCEWPMSHLCRWR